MLRVLAVPAAVLSLLAAASIQRSMDFESGDLSAWTLPKPADWEIGVEGGNHFLHMTRAGEIGEPRRPLQYAILKDSCVGDFTLDVKTRRTGASKSVLVTFGYQDTLHFYYAHLSSDDGNVRVHNGLFKVDGGERFRIAGTGSAPVLPDAGWRRIRIVRDVSTGKIDVFAGSDPQPRFHFVDRSFRWGRIGLGSFNETGDFDDLHIQGQSSNECR